MPDVSNRIRWDSLLVRYLARELDDAFARARVDALLFHPEARVAALVTERGSLVLELHPERGWLRRADAAPAGEEVRLARQPRVLGVQAPADERVLHIALGGSGAAEGRARRLVVELMGNQWNALDRTWRPRRPPPAPAASRGRGQSGERWRDDRRSPGFDEDAR